MAAITLKQFGGVSPKTPPRYLQNHQAQVAKNCPVFSGSIQPLLGMGDAVHTLDKVGTPAAIYRFGQDTLSDTQYWFHWLTDVDVVRGQISGDTEEWTFFTDGVYPKATHSSIALAGTDYPALSRRLGMAAPTGACAAAANGTADGSASSETRVYTYTFVNKEAGLEIESAPAPASVGVSVTPTTQTVDLSGFDAAPAGYVVTHRRIYRSVSGTYLYVGEMDIAATTFSDSVLAEDLDEELPSLYWAEPPDELRGLTNLPNGIMAGFVGRDVYFCDPYHPYAWPETYIQSLDYPVVGLARMDTTLAVLTTGAPYFLQGTHPDSMVVVKSDLEQACASKQSIVSFGSSALYAAPDGLMMLSPNGSSNVTASMFTYQQWRALFKPETIRAYQQDNKYIAFYDNGTTQGGFIYDSVSGQFIMHNLYATAGFHDLQQDKLYLACADRSVRVWESGPALSYEWRSKKFVMPEVSDFSCAQLEAEAYPMTVEFYVDGSRVHTETVLSRDPFRLPVATGRDFEFNIIGSYEVFNLSAASSMTELANV